MEVPSVDLVKNNYNTAAIRISILIAIFGLEFYTLYAFIVFQVSRFREKANHTKKSTHKAPKKEKSKDSDSDNKKTK